MTYISTNMTNMEATEFIFFYRNRAGKDRQEELAKRSAQYDLLRKGLSIFDRVYNLTTYSSQPDILFLGGDRYMPLINLTAQACRVVVALKKSSDRLFCLRHRLPFLAVDHWSSELTQLVGIDDQQIQTELVNNILKQIEQALATIRPQAIIGFSYTSQIDRAIAWVAKQRGIPVLTIPHGIFYQQAYSWETNGNFNDYWLVWGQYWKDMCVESGVFPSDRIYIYGYPGTITKYPVRSANKRPAICFIGQPVTLGQIEEKINEKQQIIEIVAQVCRDLSLECYYRPHPKEKGDTHGKLNANNLPEGIQFASDNETFSQSLQHYDIFFGLLSTALNEVALSGKIAVHLLYDHFPALMSEMPTTYVGDMGGTHGVEASYEAVKSFLEGVLVDNIKPIPVDPYFIAELKNPGQALSQLVRQISKDHVAFL